MTAREFTRRMKALGRSKAEGAARLVLVEGRSINGAAREHGIQPSTVSRLVGRLRRAEVCPTCGQTAETIRREREA